MFTEIVDGLLTASQIYEKRESIIDMVRRLVDPFRHGVTRVGVVGAGCTGKTTLGLILHGKLDTDKPNGDHEETISYVGMTGNRVRWIGLV